MKPQFISSFAILLALLSTNISVAAEPVGKWRGEWKSTTTGHHGPMSATVRQTSNGQYKARFTGRFALVIPFTYQTSLTPSYGLDGTVYLSANKPLGPFMGNYTMHSSVAGNMWSGGYQASKDVGTLQLRKVR